jgi:Peptidase M50B-like
MRSFKPGACHELGHAVVGLLCGRELLRIRLTATAMAVWFPDPVWSVRLTCLAGGVVQAMFGAALLLIATASSPNWLLGLRQSLEIVGAMHIGALTNLLPLPKMDGQYVCGSALRTRPVWSAYAPAVLGPVLAVALICPHLPDPELQEILALFANPVILAGMLLLLLCGLPLIPRLQLPTEAAPPTLNTVARRKPATRANQPYPSNGGEQRARSPRLSTFDIGRAAASAKTVRTSVL